jgi:hypothetical protein
VVKYIANPMHIRASITKVVPARCGLCEVVSLLAIVMAGCGSGTFQPDGGAGEPGNAAGSDGGLTEGGIGGQGGGCVDIVVSPEALGQPSEWGLVPFKSGVWRTEGGLNVGWYASVGAPVSRPWLYVATFDPSTGVLQRLRRYDVLPPDATINDSNIRAISGSSDEAFAASLRSYDVVAGQPRDQTLFIGRLDDDSVQLQVDLGWKSDAEDVADIGWDGEAFAAHAYLASTHEIFVARATPEGNLVLPSTKFGTTPSSAAGYRTSTNSASGMTFLFDAPGSGRFLSAHDLSGNAPSWASPAPLDLAIPGSTMADDSAFRPGVEADSDGGAWAAWVTYDAGGGFVRAAAHVTSRGVVDQSFILSLSTGQTSPAVGGGSAKTVWIADSDGYNIFAATFSDGVLSTPVKAVTGPFASGSGDVWHPDNMASVDWKNERWLSFTENAGVLHIVRIQAGCTYRSALSTTTN